MQGYEIIEVATVCTVHKVRGKVTKLQARLDSSSSMSVCVHACVCVWCQYACVHVMWVWMYAVCVVVSV